MGLLVLAWWLAVVRTHHDLAKFEQEFHTRFDPLVTASLVTLFFVVLLLIALRKTGPLAGVRWPILGAITYPLYLLHQNIGYMIFNALYPQWNQHLLFWGTVATMIVGSLAIHLLLEKPIARQMKRALSPSLADRPAAA